MVREDTIPAKRSSRQCVGPEKDPDGEIFSIEGMDEARIAFELEYVRKKLAHYHNDIEKTAKAISVTPSYIHSILEIEST
jgi:3-methyladenine DNA glycosylase AlkC